MALRVLLADESSTIKKVVQLTLQDFDVDVRSVSVGLDVLSVAKTFRPDVVMADVLLAKRSGYEICHDLKNDPETASIPVILMWSGFMEIDEQKARISGADRRIEKPFDPSVLRDLVKELVHKTLTNPVSSYIQFPPLPEFQESAQGQIPTASAQTSKTSSAVTTTATPTQPRAEIPFPKEVSNDSSSISISFDGLETTSAVPTPVIEDSVVVDDDSELEVRDEWVQAPPPGRANLQPSITAKPLHTAQTQTSEEFAEFQLNTVPKKATTAIAKQMGESMGAGQEEVLRQEIQKWLSAHMPSIAERIIRDEINRLLQDSEQTIEGS